MPVLFWQLQSPRSLHRLFPCSLRQTKLRLFQLQVQVLPWVQSVQSVQFCPWDPSVQWVQLHPWVQLSRSVQSLLSGWMEIPWVLWGLLCRWGLSQQVPWVLLHLLFQTVPSVQLLPPIPWVQLYLLVQLVQWDRELLVVQWVQVLQAVQSPPLVLLVLSLLLVLCLRAVLPVRLPLVHLVQLHPWVQLCPWVLLDLLFRLVQSVQLSLWDLLQSDPWVQFVRLVQWFLYWLQFHLRRPVQSVQSVLLFRLSLSDLSVPWFPLMKVQLDPWDPWDQWFLCWLLFPATQWIP